MLKNYNMEALLYSWNFDARFVTMPLPVSDFRNFLSAWLLLCWGYLPYLQTFYWLSKAILCVWCTSLYVSVFVWRSLFCNVCWFLWNFTYWLQVKVIYFNFHWVDKNSIKSTMKPLSEIFLVKRENHVQDSFLYTSFVLHF